MAIEDSIVSPEVNVPLAIKRLKFLGSNVPYLILPVFIYPVGAKTVVDCIAIPLLPDVVNAIWFELPTKSTLVAYPPTPSRKVSVA